ncbi:Arm DNA-binding domain-containing protein, partial [Neisseria bacilliformis]|uniref:Arm DNA-binding domain-containing protein n=1 Tax=Neisseria bacilliformis TaxID=267212 RepID=UPI0028EB58E3
MRYFLRYRQNAVKKYRKYRIGKYPAVSLLEARQAAEMARADLAKGADPAAVKKQAKAQRQAALQNT